MSGEVRAFEMWCQVNGIEPFPVVPAVLSDFVRHHASSGIDRLCAAVQAIAESDMKRGAGNAAATPMVNEALANVAGGAIPLPRSWPKANAGMFEAMPFALQRYVADRSREQDRVVRRAQNEAAQARQERKAS